MGTIFKAIKDRFRALIFERPIIKAFWEIKFKGLKDHLKGFKSTFKELLKDFQKIAQKHQKSQPLFSSFLFLAAKLHEGTRRFGG